MIARAEPAARFAVVGGAVLGWRFLPDDLGRLAGELGITERVVFAGHQSDVIPWLAHALDVVVHASYGEPFGLVLVEAMAIGKPLIASADGGPLEIVEDGISGLLVPRAILTASRTLYYGSCTSPASPKLFPVGAINARNSFPAKPWLRDSHHFSTTSYERMTDGSQPGLGVREG